MTTDDLRRRATDRRVTVDGVLAALGALIFAVFVAAHLQALIAWLG